MSSFNPFEHPPSTPRVDAIEAVVAPAARSTSRVKLAGVAVAGAALMGGAIFGVSMFASADQPEVLSDAPRAGAERIEGVAATADAAADDDQGEPAGEMPDVGMILGDFGDCLGLGDLFAELGELGSEMHGGFDRQIGPDADGDQMWSLDGTTVTVTGPDGIDIYTIGEGDGSITVTRAGDEVVVTTDGDVDESPLFDFEDFNLEDFDFEDFDLEDFDLEDFDLEDFDLEDFDLEDFNLEDFNLEDFNLEDFDVAGTPLGDIGECLSNLDVTDLGEFRIGESPEG